MIRTFGCICILLLALGCAPVESRAPRPPAPRAQAPAAETPNSALTGTVARVVDGDTLRVDLPGGQERVRLIGMDTPEMRPEEPFGPEATEAAQRLCPPGTRVKLQLDVESRDRYGRLLAYVYLPDGTMLNAELLRQGLAAVMTVPPNVKHAQAFLRLQQEARTAGLGVWGQDASNPEANANRPTP